MDSKKRKMIKKAVLGVFKEDKWNTCTHKELSQRAMDRLATKGEISMIIGEMIESGELSLADPRGTIKQ